MDKLKAVPGDLSKLSNVEKMFLKMFLKQDPV